MVRSLYEFIKLISESGSMYNLTTSRYNHCSDDILYMAKSAPQNLWNLKQVIEFEHSITALYNCNRCFSSTKIKFSTAGQKIRSGRIGTKCAERLEVYNVCKLDNLLKIPCWPFLCEKRLSNTRDKRALRSKRRLYSSVDCLLRTWHS